MSDIWESVQKNLMNSLGEHDYRNWIKDARFSAIDSGVAVVELPTEFRRDWVSRNYGSEFLANFQKLDSRVARVEFRTASHPVSAQAEIAVESKPYSVDQNAGAEENFLQSVRLSKHLTFDSFVVGKSNTVAHAAAWRIAQDDYVDFNPLFFCGAVGLGKTHLMHAVGWAFRSKNPDAKAVYLSAEQFMYQFVRSLRTRTMMEFKEAFRTVDLLMVDDVQFIAGKDSTQEEFFHTFNHLVNDGKKIILSGDRSPGQIEGMEKRITTRLQSGLVARLHPTDYELRLGILQQKSDDLRARNRYLAISDGVLQFLARRITGNVRILEGALNRLNAEAAYLEREITLPLAQELLSDILRESEKRVEIDEVIRTVSEYFGIRASDLTGPKRTQNIARSRQVAVYLVKSLTVKSLSEIGRRFGNRDHSTVLHSVRRVEKMMAEDNRFANDIEMLRRKLET